MAGEQSGTFRDSGMHQGDGMPAVLELLGLLGLELHEMFELTCVTTAERRAKRDLILCWSTLT